MTAPSLFAWQRAAIAGLPTDMAMTAVRIALDSNQSTGRDVVINDSAVAADIGCSARTVWRRVKQLVEDGWLTQTATPSYGGVQEKGRRARYELRIPGQSSDTAPPVVADVPPVDTCQPPPEDDKRPERTPDTTPPDVAHDNPSRLTNQARSSATATADDGTLSAFGSSNNSSSSCEPGSADPLVGDAETAIAILASKLRQHTPIAGLRTDKLKPHQATRIAALVAEHGDQRLVDQALAGLRRDNPPQTIQAFLPGWENIPPPGQHLALVKEPPCAAPGHQGTVRHCVQCASEKKAAK